MRPFLEHWDLQWDLELKRQSGHFNYDRHAVSKELVRLIGIDEFLDHYHDTYALMEIALFYNDNPMRTKQDLNLLIEQMAGNENHMDVFDFAIYFAAWIKAEVGNSKLKFKHLDA